MNTRRYSARSAFVPIKISLSVLYVVFLVDCAGVQPTAETGNGRFEFALIGDQQYTPEPEANFPNIMDDVNRANLAFVVHVGDFKRGATACSDELFMQRREQFNASKHPFIYTPGNNDWTDCHGSKPSSDPVERLAKIREIFFNGNRSLGQRSLILSRQSDDLKYATYRENARWTIGGILFATVHLPGSNNNLGRSTEADNEYRDRNDANLAWLGQVFGLAKRNGNKAVVLFAGANPGFEDRLPPRRLELLRVARPDGKPSGFADILSVLERETLAFNGPVVLMHGDTHYFRVDKPLFRSKERSSPIGRQIENFTRVETFGYPEAHWVRVIVEPQDAGVFSFKEEIVDKNRFGKR